MIKKTKKQTFLQGALILVCANVMVKVIGAIFKIPLATLIKSDGMGLFNSAYGIYTVMFIVATAGFPTVISKMVAESCALGRQREGNTIFKVSLIMLLVIGILGSAALYFGAEFIAKTFLTQRSTLGIMAIAPAVLCVSIMSAFRGYFQGKQNMYPTAISEVIEATGKLVIGYIMASMLLPKGLELASAGAVFGVTCGTFLGVIALVIIYIFSNKKVDKDDGVCRKKSQIAKELVKLAIPITVGASVASLTNLADMVTVIKRLGSIGQLPIEFMQKYALLIGDSTVMTETIANKLYGLYTGFAVPLFNMPLTIVVALAMSVVPVIAGALAKKNSIEAKTTTSSVIRITILFAMPCAVGISVLSGPILKLVFMSAASEAVLATSLLQKLALAIIFVSLLQVTTAILQSYGKVTIPVINMLIGGIIKVVINYILVAIPSINIEGAPIGTLVCYFITVALNMFFVIKYTGVKLGIMDFVVKPIIAATAMGVTTVVTYNFVFKMLSNNALSTIIAIGVAAIIYFVLIFLLRIIKKTDIEMLPYGSKIAEKLVKMHIL